MLLVASGLLLNFSHTSSPANAASPWQVPVEHPVLAREFLQPSADWSSGHRGVDYLATFGQTVFASQAGKVTFSGRVVNRGVVSIAHEGGLSTSYEPLCSKVTQGDLVNAGEVIGTVCAEPGYTSHCGMQTCLHFAMKDSNGYLSPLIKIGGLSPSRLKPWDGLNCSLPSGVQC